MTEPARTIPEASIVGKLLGPLVAFVASTIVAYVGLWRLSSAIGGADLASYPAWLLSVVSFDLIASSDRRDPIGLFTRWRNTFEITLIGVILALAYASILGVLARISRVVGWVVAGVSTSLASMTAPLVATVLLYWLGVKFDLVPVVSRATWSDSVGDHLKGLVLPSLTIAIVLAPTLVGWVSPSAGSGSAAELADQPGLGLSRSRGLPVATLFGALMVVELVFGVRGVFSGFFDALSRFDLTLLGVVTGQMLVAGLLAGLVGSFGADFLPTDDDERGRSPAALPALVVGGVAWVLVAVLLVVGWVTDSTSLSRGDGGLVGANRLGQSLLALTADGVVSSLAWPLLTGLVATAVGLVAVVLLGQLGELGEWLVSLPIQALSGPAVVVLPLLLLGFQSRQSLLLAIGLIAIAIPVCARLLAASADRISLQGIAGTWLLASSWIFALLTMLGAVNLLPAVAGRRELFGSQLGVALREVTFDARPAVIVGFAVIAVGLAFRATGSALLALARPANT